MGELRSILEPGIAVLAAERVKDDDLAAMREAVANPLILSLIDSSVGLLRVERIRIFKVEGGPQRNQFHHKRILEAVERYDPESASRATRAHLQQVRQDSQVSSSGKSSGKHAPPGSQNLA